MITNQTALKAAQVVSVGGWAETAIRVAGLPQLSRWCTRSQLEVFLFFLQVAAVDTGMGAAVFGG